MKFIYWPQKLSEDQSDYLVEGDQAHHLLNVLRINAREQLTILDGQGSQVICAISEIQKRTLRLQRFQFTSFPPSKGLALGIFIPKKEALELMIKMAVEMGISGIYLLKSGFSHSLNLDLDRLHRIAVSALEQSGNPYLPKIHPPLAVKDFSFQSWNRIFIPSSQMSENSLQNFREEDLAQSLLLIGPEGGFSPEEHQHFQSFPQTILWRFATPIMRAPTAFAFSVGFLMGEFASAAKV